MQIENLAHILRAAKAITGETVFVLLGSQAVLGQFPRAPQSLLHSPEVDLYPQEKPELADLIEGALGSGSMFDATFGYHADGVGPETGVLPAGWEARRVRLEGHPSLDGAIAVCPEIHDLAASKLAAFRDKDRDWVEAAIGEGLVDPEVLAQRVAGLPDRDWGIPHDAIRAWVEARRRGDEPPPP